MDKNGIVSVGFSELAQEKIKEFMKEQNAEEFYLRITVMEKPEGGAAYEFGIEEAVAEDDEIVNQDVPTIASFDSARLLDGANIDYVDSLQRSGFVISNPNFAGKCACGGGGCCGGGN